MAHLRPQPSWRQRSIVKKSLFWENLANSHHQGNMLLKQKKKLHVVLYYENEYLKIFFFCLLSSKFTRNFFKIFRQFSIYLHVLLKSLQIFFYLIFSEYYRQSASIYEIVSLIFVEKESVYQVVMEGRFDSLHAGVFTSNACVCG